MNPACDVAVMTRRASVQASLLVRSSRFTSDDWPDLRQELVLDCFRRSRRFDPSRGEWRGFVNGVMRNQAAKLVVRERRRAPEVLANDLVSPQGIRDTLPLDALDTRTSDW